jgi:hypothetical protein
MHLGLLLGVGRAGCSVEAAPFVALLRHLAVYELVNRLKGQRELEPTEQLYLPGVQLGSYARFLGFAQDRGANEGFGSAVKLELTLGLEEVLPKC